MLDLASDATRDSIIKLLPSLLMSPDVKRQHHGTEKVNMIEQPATKRQRSQDDDEQEEEENDLCDAKRAKMS